MIWRALFGIIPMLVIALVVSGAVPNPFVPSVRDAAGVVEVIKAVDAAERADRRSRSGMSPGEVSETFRQVDSSLDAEVKRRAPMEKKRDERVRRERLRSQGKEDWAPTSGGWGR